MKKCKISLLFIASGFLSSCGVSVKSVDKGFEKMKGKPITVAYSLLGLPYKKFEGKKLGMYMWDKSYSYNSSYTNTSYDPQSAYSYDGSLRLDYTIKTTDTYSARNRARASAFITTTNGLITKTDWTASGGRGVNEFSKVSEYGEE